MVGLLSEPIQVNRRERARGLDAVPASLGESVTAAAEEAFVRNPVPSINRWIDRSDRETEDDGLNLLPAEVANDQFGIEGELSFDGPTDATTARELYHLKRDEIQRREVMGRAGDGALTVAANLGAGFLVSAVDPINVASAFVPVIGPARYAIALSTRAGAIARAGLRARVGAVEGAAGAALVEPIVFGLAQQEQADYGAVDALLNVAFGTVLGGGLHAGGGAVLDRVRISRSGRDLEARRDEVAAGVAELVEAGEVNRVADVEAAAAPARETQPTDPPIADRSGELDMTRPDNLDGIVYRLDPREIEVDAATFQFKAGGDANGVTDRLSGVTQWDPAKAGSVMVYERADGVRFIADGHQRLGLARRIQESNPDQDIALFGYIFRESDGHTPAGIRLRAAMVNIAQGTGTAIDAAKVLRVDPAVLDDPTFPKRSELVRQAQDLVELDDEAFLLVVNEVVPANQAALVGRLAPKDPQLQQALLRLLASEEPASVVEAEAIVRQGIAAGTKVETQTGLFGEETIADSLFGTRAKVLSRAVRLLKQDKQVFSTLTDNAGRIEAAGNNRLDAAANKDIANASGNAVEILQILANRSGGVADALNGAARAVADGGDIRAAARSVADSVSDAAASGDLSRILADAGQPADGRGAAEGGSGRELAGRSGRTADAADQDGPSAPGAAESGRDLERTGQLEPGTPLEEIVNPIDPALSPEEKVARLAEMTAENKPAVDAFLADLDAEFGTQSKSSIKKPDTIIEKAQRPAVRAAKPWHDVEHIRDSFRFKTILEDIEDLPAIVDFLRTNLGAIVVKADVAKFLAPKEWGFRIVAFDLQMPNGQLVEYYLPVRELEAAKKPNHLIFEKWRNENIAGLDEAGRLDFIADLEASNASYQAAYETYLARVQSDESAVAASLARAVASAGDTIENSAAIASAENVSGTDQAPSASRANTPSRETTNARPSSASPAARSALTSVDAITRTSDLDIDRADLDFNAEDPGGQSTFVEPITQAERNQAAADAPLSGRNDPLDDGLFDVSGRGQGDLLDLDTALADAEADLAQLQSEGLIDGTEPELLEAEALMRDADNLAAAYQAGARCMGTS